MTLATKITLIRVAFIPAYLVLMYLSGGHANLYMWLALGIFILASITDYVDGHIARKYHQVSDFGKFLDPLADKLLTLAAMTMFCQWGTFPAWALMIVLTREFAVSGLRMVAAPKGKVIAASWWGKIKTNVQMFAIMIALLLCGLGNPEIAGFSVAGILIWVAAIFTVASWIAYIFENLSVFKDEK
jgi:CDP-diacylglycerol--glycerol-3-phosphate 3-phosphatidyltransferase